MEAVELVGHSNSNKSPIMVTAGGCDGRVRFWDWKTFAALGSLRIHPGQQHLINGIRTNAMFSPVVTTFFCHERSSLISFCRDGHVHEWKVEEETKKFMAEENESAGTSTMNDANNKQGGKQDQVHRIYRTRTRLRDTRLSRPTD